MTKELDQPRGQRHPGAITHQRVTVQVDAVWQAKEELADILRTEQGRPIMRLLADIW